MRFMMMVKADENYEAGLPPSPELLAAIGKHSEAMMKAGVLLQTGGLAPSSKGARLRLAKGKVTATDGPFLEAKEFMGGFYLIDVPDLDAAIDWAKKLPAAQFGTIEVRPVWPTES